MVKLMEKYNLCSICCTQAAPTIACQYVGSKSRARTRTILRLAKLRYAKFGTRMVIYFLLN